MSAPAPAQVTVAAELEEGLGPGLSLPAGNFGSGPDIESFNLLIAANGNLANRLPTAFAVFQRMSQPPHLLEPNARSYAALIAACGRARRLVDGLAVYEEMKARHITPDGAVFGELIQACARCQQPEKAFELFDEIQAEYYLSPNRRAYASLIIACSASGDVQRAIKVLGDMEDAGLSPMVHEYNALLAVCAEARDGDSAFDVLKQMAAARVQPDVRSYTRLLRACGVSKTDPSQADETGAQVADGLEQAMAAVSGLDGAPLEETGPGGRSDRAFIGQVLQTLERVQTLDLEPKTARPLYIALLKAAAEAQQPALIYRVLAELDKAKIPKDRAVYIEMLNAFRLCGRLPAVEATMRQMRDAGHEPGNIGHNILMCAAVEAGTPARAMTVFEEAFEGSAKGMGRLIPDAIGYTTAINAAGQALQLDRAFELFELMQTASFTTDERTWCLLVKGCGESMDYARALQTFSLAVENDITPTSRLYNALMVAAGKSCDLAECDRVFDQMLGQRIEPNSISYNILMHYNGELRRFPVVEQVL